MAMMAMMAMMAIATVYFLEKVYLTVRARMTFGDPFSLKAIGWRGLLEFNFDVGRNRTSALARRLPGFN